MAILCFRLDHQPIAVRIMRLLFPVFSFQNIEVRERSHAKPSRAGSDPSGRPLTPKAVPGSRCENVPCCFGLTLKSHTALTIMAFSHLSA
jgi:hypothetical protein